MTWKDDKDLGPWDFIPQPNKWGYLNNPRWLDTARKFVKGGPDDYDGRESLEPQVWPSIDRMKIMGSGSEVTHELCGHWHKPIPVIPPAPPEPPPVDDLYILHGSPANLGVSDGRDECHKRTKGLAAISQYGTPGNGIDQLNCPWGLAVDGTYVWICDVNNSRLMQRLKSDLSYVQHEPSSTYGFVPYCVHAKEGNLIWIGALAVIREVLKSDLSVVRAVVSAVGGDFRGSPAGCRDLTCDDTYLYVADNVYRRIYYYDLATLTYAGEFGYYPYWTTQTWAAAYGGGNLFISDAGIIRKINPTTFARVASYGHLTGGRGSGNVKANGLFADATKVYVLSYTAFDKEIQILDHNLNYIANITHVSLDYPYAIYADANYIYVACLDKIVRFNASTYAYVDSTDNSFSYLTGLTGDDTYLYVIDQNDDLRIVRFLKSTMAYVDEYTDVGWNVFGSPISLTIDETYLYAIENSPQVIHRLTKADMVYVDAHTPSDTYKTAPSIVVGSEIYLSEYFKSVNGGGIQVYDTTSFALIRESPETQGDEDMWMKAPWGVTCDEDYIYMTDQLLLEIKIFDKAAPHDFVGKFSVPDTPYHLTVDDQFIYVVCNKFDTVTSTSRKYLKTAPYTEIVTQTEEFALSIDTAYIYQV